MNTYNIGALVRLTGTFKDSAGALQDPTTVKFKYRKPDTTEVEHIYPAVIVRDSLGVFRVDVSATLAGQWDYRWVATGTGQAAEAGSFLVRPSIVTP